MSFNATKCKVDYKGGFYYVGIIINLLDTSGNVLVTRLVETKVVKADYPTMKAELIANLKPLIDAEVLDMQDESSGHQNMADTILTQVNTYLGTK